VSAHGKDILLNDREQDGESNKLFTVQASIDGEIMGQAKNSIKGMPKTGSRKGFEHYHLVGRRESRKTEDDLHNKNVFLTDSGLMRTF